MPARRMSISLLFLPLALLACTEQSPELAVAPRVLTQRGPVVRTIATGLGLDHLLVDRGQLIASTQTTVTRYTLRGTEPTVIATGFQFAACKAYDSRRNLFVVDFAANSVTRITARGERSTIAADLIGPVGCAIDSRDRLYVGEAGVGQTPGTRILRFAPDGTRDVFVDFAASAVPIFALSGLAIDRRDRVYVANYVDGRIARVSTRGVASLYTTLPIAPAPGNFAVSYLAFADEHLYATGLSSQKIYRVDEDGANAVFAGTGVQGDSDGPVATATFNFPNGIAAGPVEQLLYVSDAGSGALRTITTGRER